MVYHIKAKVSISFASKIYFCVFWLFSHIFFMHFSSFPKKNISFFILFLIRMYILSKEDFLFWTIRIIQLYSFYKIVYQNKNYIDFFLVKLYI